ncbi:hypothetical protein C8Q76DRAFT_795736 [Earliella scabrosa]|nr:hypothetical protein C8Q76DRAFT_795736 [Earliella scabrosa]
MAPEIRFNAFGIPYLVEFANVTFRSRSRTGSVSTSATTSASHYTSNASSASHYTSSASSLASSSLHRPSYERQPSLRHLRPTPSVATFDSDWTFCTGSSETLAALPTVKGAGTSKQPGSKYAPSSPFLSPTSKPLPEITIEREIETDGEGLLIRFASALQPHPHAQPMPERRLSRTRLARLKYRIAKAVLAAGMDSSPGAELANPFEGGDVGRASFSSIRSEEVETRGMPSSLFRGTYGQVMSALTAAGLTAAPCKESGVQHATRLGALFVARQNPYGGVEFTKLTLWA